jgi:hypothetical protein
MSHDVEEWEPMKIVFGGAEVLITGGLGFIESNVAAGSSTSAPKSRSWTPNPRLWRHLYNIEGIRDRIP